MSLPNITAEGRLGRDPELRFTSSGKAVASFTIACGERRKNQSTGEWEDAGTTWLDCTVWESKAEAVAEQLTKGDLVAVTGRLKQREFQAKDGTTKRAWDVQVDTVAKVVTAARTDRSAVRPAAADPWATAPAAGGYTSDEAPF